MLLDPRICSAARRSRDPRFDGRFFVAVTTTGIYCRPVCPAPSPREANVRYYASAAAAMEAGFRPCLRCRPETAPGTTPWLGTARTVSRALRLLDGVASGADDVERLAERVGVSSRHLRRLFLAQLGASPGTLARTRRLQLAKTLLDDTSLPLAQVALAAGYGSVRRFNAAFLSAYGRPPSTLRRARPHGPEGEYAFRLRARPPFDGAALLAFLASRATPGVELVADSSYRRTLATPAGVGVLEARVEADAVAVRLRLPAPEAIAPALDRVRRLFDLAADPAAIADQLGSDRLLAPRLAARPGLRVPGAWDGFELAVRAVLGQQVAVASATSLAGRLVRRLGQAVETGVPGLTHLFPGPGALAGADAAALGLPKRRAETLRALGRAVADGLVLDATADPAAARAALLRLPGIGEWTAEYVAMRALGEPDAFPAGDLWLLRATGSKAPRALARRAEPWRPWRAYAALHLWQGVKDDDDQLRRDREPARTPARRR